MPGGLNPDPPPRTRSFNFGALVREATKHLPRNPVVYPFSKGKQRRDSGSESGIYALREYAGTLYDDLTANQATLSQETIDGFTRSLKITPTSADGQAQLIVSTQNGYRYKIQYQYYSNSVDEAGRMVMYDGDQRSFGASEPNRMVASARFDAVSVWKEGEETFTAESDITMIGMEANYPNPVWIRSLSISIVSGTSTLVIRQRVLPDGSLRTVPDGTSRKVRTKKV